MDDQGEGSFDASKTPLFESVGFGGGFAEGVLVYAGGESSIDSHG
jgi:hypothetical protein